MHGPPSVSHPVGRSRFAGALMAVLAAAGLAAVSAWAWQSAAPGWRQALAFAAVAACTGIAARAWWVSPRGLLRWDGGGWLWEEGGAASAGRVGQALDLQSRLLVRFHPETGAPRWLWLERDAAPADWDALRRAVYFRANNTAPQGVQPPAAER